MINLKKLCLLVYVVGCFTQAHGADKYTDENRPYEFGFTIEGEQHRHEKKDENGIIMGEFGFITADGVYHVTVYATDENGNFKILSMKNIRVKPYPTAPGIDVRHSSKQVSSNAPSKELTIPNTNSRQGHSIEFVKSQQGQSQQYLSKEEVQQENNAGPARSCSHCSVPTTTTPAPKLPPPVSTINQFNQHNYGQSQGQSFSNTDQNSPTDYQASSALGQFNPQAPGLQQNPDSGRINPQDPGLQQNYQQNSATGQLNPQGPVSPGNYQQTSNVAQYNPKASISQENYQQNSAVGEYNPQAPVSQGDYQQNSAAGINNSEIPEAERNYQQYSDAEGIYQGNIGVGQNNPQPSISQGNYQQNSDVGQSNPQTPGSQGNYEQNSAGEVYNPQVPSAEGNNQQYSNIGAYQTNPGENYNNQQKSQIGEVYESNQGNRQSYGQGSAVNQTPVSREQQSLSQNSLSGNRNPKSFKEILQSAIPDQQYNSVDKSQSNVGPLSEKPVLIAAQMQIVDKNTDIYHKNPGENDGLPKGLSSNDMSQLLYTFNYTVGFHGHHEEGYLNGVKQGYYYVTGRNGIRTRVDYVADEKGFHPRISQEVLDISSDEVPKPETEKDEKYGLRGYEFKWLYYAVDSKRR